MAVRWKWKIPFSPSRALEIFCTSTVKCLQLNQTFFMMWVHLAGKLHDKRWWVVGCAWLVVGGVQDTLTSVWHDLTYDATYDMSLFLLRFLYVCFVSFFPSCLAYLFVSVCFAFWYLNFWRVALATLSASQSPVFLGLCIVYAARFYRWQRQTRSFDLSQAPSDLPTTPPALQTLCVIYLFIFFITCVTKFCICFELVPR